MLDDGRQNKNEKDKYVVKVFYLRFIFWYRKWLTCWLTDKQQTGIALGQEQLGVRGEEVGVLGGGWLGFESWGARDSLSRTHAHVSAPVGLCRCGHCLIWPSTLWDQTFKNKPTKLWDKKCEKLKNHRCSIIN